MFNDKLVPKIIDFGIANEEMRGVGTKLYFTPEEYYKEFDFNLKKVDYWGLGIILFMLIKKKEPDFLRKPLDQLKLGEDEYDEEISYEAGEDESTLKFVEAMLRPNPSNRDLE